MKSQPTEPSTIRLTGRVEGFYVGTLSTIFSLKLAGVVAWSWWWVTIQVWLPALLALVILFAIGVVIWLVSFSGVTLDD